MESAKETRVQRTGSHIRDTKIVEILSMYADQQRSNATERSRQVKTESSSIHPPIICGFLS